MCQQQSMKARKLGYLDCFIFRPPEADLHSTLSNVIRLGTLDVFPNVCSDMGNRSEANLLSRLAENMYSHS